MPISLIGSNLNQWGDSGNFETDPSTWGFSVSPLGRQRVFDQFTKGIASMAITFLNPADWPFFLAFGINVSKSRALIDPSKKYSVRAKVQSNALYPLASDDCKLVFYFGIGPAPTYESIKTLADAGDNWQQIEARFDGADLVGSISTYDFFLKLVPGGPGSTLNNTVLTNALWIDEFEIYEYIDVPEGPPPPPDDIEKVWWSRNPITFEAAAAPGWDALTNVRIYNDVQVDENFDDTYVSKLKTDLPPDTDGNVVFYNQEAFTDSLRATPPTLNDDTIVKLTDRLKKFRNNTAQLQDDQIEPPGEVTTSAPHLVLLGGLSKLAWASIDYFGDYLPTNKKFLTWAPVTKPVDKNQEDYLNFFIYNDLIATLKLQIKAYYDDGSDQTSVVASFVGAQYADLYQIPAGPFNTGAALINPAKNLLKYDLSLLDQDDVLISEVRTYILDAVGHPRKRLFMFLNSLGGYEILRFTGVNENSAVISKTEIAKFLPHNYGAQDGEFEMNDVSLRESNSSSSGYKDMTVEWIDYLKDLLLSRRVFEVTSGVRVPIEIQPGTYSIKADQNFEMFIRFVALDAYQDESYTPKKI